MEIINMDNINTYNKISKPEIVETVNLNGKYVNVADLKTKIVTASTTSVFVIAFITFIILLFS
jgi:hypothetical protein